MVSANSTKPYMNMSNCAAPKKSVAFCVVSKSTRPHEGSPPLGAKLIAPAHAGQKQNRRSRLEFPKAGCTYPQCCKAVIVVFRDLFGCIIVERFLIGLCLATYLAMN